MKKLFYNLNNEAQPSSVEVNDEITVGEFIKIISTKHSITEQLNLFLIDGDEIIDLQVTLTEIGIGKHHHHVICHKCKEVKAIVVFNGEEYPFHVKPGVTIAELTKKACAHFKITGQDAAKQVLKLNNEEQPSDLHLGKLVSEETHCSVRLELCPKVVANG